MLNLKPHPEGGFYAETYRSVDACALERYDARTRACSTAIYYLLKSPESPKSHFHRIKADEMWHFYRGLPLIIHVLDDADGSYAHYVLSNELSTSSSDARPQILVPHGKWFAAEIDTSQRQVHDGNDDDYTLCGCTCTPGFDYQDYTLAKRSDMIEKFPQHEELIQRLTLSE